MSPDPQTVRLFSAIMVDSQSEVMTSIALGADLNCENLDGRIPLEVATKLGAAQSVAVLLDAGCVFRNAPAALNAAVDSGSLATLKLVLDLVPPDVLICANGSYTPLLHAAQCGQIEMCRLLLERGSDPKVRGSYGQSLLSHALSTSRPRPSKSILELVEFLLESGAPVRPIGCSSASVLRDAIDLCLNNQEHINESLGLKLCELLINAGANVNAVYLKESALHRIVSHYARTDGQSFFDPGLFPMLIKHGADVNACNLDGQNPLQRTAAVGHAAALKQLIDCGAALNATDGYGRTALHWSKDFATTKLLLDAGADHSIRNNDGLTAEDCAGSAAGVPDVYDILKSAREQIELERAVSPALITSNRIRV
jgi:ankyrin repeat protein